MKFLSSLPTEYQMAFIFALIAVACWGVSALSPALASSLGALFAFLGTLAGGFLVHGGFVRRSTNCSDLIGDTPHA